VDRVQEFTWKGSPEKGPKFGEPFRVSPEAVPDCPPMDYFLGVS
jgi:hypothetical protein